MNARINAYRRVLVSKLRFEGWEFRDGGEISLPSRPPARGNHGEGQRQSLAKQPLRSYSLHNEPFRTRLVGVNVQVPMTCLNGTRAT